MRLSVVLKTSFGTCLASVVHELVQRLEDAAPLARPDAADGRRHRRLGEVGYVLGQLLLVLFLHRRRFVWLPRPSRPSTAGKPSRPDIIQKGAAKIRSRPPRLQGNADLALLHFKARETGGCRYGHRGQRDTSLHTAAGRLS